MARYKVGDFFSRRDEFLEIRILSREGDKYRARLFCNAGRDSSEGTAEVTEEELQELIRKNELKKVNNA